MGDMRISGRGFADLLLSEAIVTRRYKDSVGVWTYGLGHTAAAGRPDPEGVMTDQPLADILALARADLRKYEADVNSAVKVELSQPEFDALVSFHFNTGKIKRATLTKKLNAGDRAGAAAAFMAYKKPASIIERRKREQHLFATGEYANTAMTAMVYPATDDGHVQWRLGRKMRIADIVAPMPTAAPLSVAPPVVDRAPDLDADIAAGIITDRERIKDVQQSLQDFGYPPGGIDGSIGPVTVGALAAYRHDRGLPVSDKVDRALISDMMMAAGEQWKRPVSLARATMPVKDIVAKSRTLQASKLGKIIAGIGLGGGAAGQGVKGFLDPDNIDGNLSLVQRVFDFVGANWPMLAGIGIAAGVAYGALKLIEHFKIEDYRLGIRP